jgi:hypothetical protein
MASLIKKRSFLSVSIAGKEGWLLCMYAYLKVEEISLVFAIIS